MILKIKNKCWNKNTESVQENSMLIYSSLFLCIFYWYFKTIIYALFKKYDLKLQIIRGNIKKKKLKWLIDIKVL